MLSLASKVRVLLELLPAYLCSDTPGLAAHCVVEGEVRDKRMEHRHPEAWVAILQLARVNRLTAGEMVKDGRIVSGEVYKMGG
ncbi:hypothetical protein EI94DRAFT_1735948 [Lactarius quietus]|nr:hypothetical protein EI94DRAFT_1735948 [Lactarius quietus]